MIDKLDIPLAPHERMAEIRRLVREAAARAREAGQMQIEADQATEGSAEMWAALDLSDIRWKEHDAMVVDLLEHLSRAEARGELGDCEGFLSMREEV